jgi:hypothetical protein
LEEEKVEANNVAYQWQSEAMHFEREVAVQNDALVQTQQELSRWQERLQETERQLAQSQAQAQQQQQRLQEKEAESSSAHSPHTPQQPARQQKKEDNSNSNSSSANQPSQEDFWVDNGDDVAGDSFSARSPQSVASSSSAAASASALSSSVAKRILLTWDKTMVERNKIKNAQKMLLARAKAGRSVSRTTFLMTVSECAPIHPPPPFFCASFRFCIGSSDRST